jgi:hypothetical protein
MTRRLINIRNNPNTRRQDPLHTYYKQTNMFDYSLMMRGAAGSSEFSSDLVLSDPRLYVSNARELIPNFGEMQNLLPHIVWNAGGSPGPEDPSYPPTDSFDLMNFISSSQDQLRYGNGSTLTQEMLGRQYAAQNNYVYLDENGTLASFSAEMIEKIITDARMITEDASTMGGYIGSYFESFRLGELTNETQENFDFAYRIIESFSNDPEGENISRVIFENENEFSLLYIQGIPNGAERRMNYIGSFRNVREMILDLSSRVSNISTLTEDKFSRLFPDNGSVQFSSLALLSNFYLYVLSVSIIKSIPQDRQNLVREALLSSDIQNNNLYEYLNLILETPYTTTQATNQYLTGRQGDVEQFGYEAKASSVYNYYYKEYELGVSSSVINQEDRVRAVNSLPNAYVKNLYSSPDRSIPENLLRRYETAVTLDRRIGNNFALSRGSLIPEYFNSYGSVVSNNVDGIREFSLETNSQISNLCANLVIPSSEYGVFSETSRNRYTNPMFAEISFTREEPGEIGYELWENNISSPLMSLVVDFDARSEISNRSVKEFITTYIATEGDSAGEQKESSTSTGAQPRGLDLPVTTFDLGEFFQKSANINLNSSLVLMENKPLQTPGGPVSKDEPFAGRLSTTQAQRLRNVENAAIRRAEEYSELAYNSILTNPEYITPSEVLGYRIEKRNDNSTATIQNIVIGNAPSSQVAPLVSSYIDTQILYGKEYQYSLYEYRLVYGTKYKISAIAPLLDTTLIRNLLPIGTKEYCDNALDWYLNRSGLQERTKINFQFYVEEEQNAMIYEIPLYEKEFYRQVRFLPGTPSGFFYPSVKVLDRPPSPPEVSFYPYVGNSRQISINVDPQVGSYLGEDALEVINLGSDQDRIDELYNYQKEFTNYNLQPGTLEFANETLSDVRNITIYRTTQMDLNVESHKDLYRSFSNETANVFRYSTDFEETLRNEIEAEYVRCYDVQNNIQPNVDYFYTVTVTDRHGNVSNPSQIFRIKLHLEKGLLVPEIERVEPKRISTKKPTKNLARYIKIEPSNIQTFPLIRQRDDGIYGERSLGSSLGQPLENETIIVRLTSKDTGKKFDLKLNFRVKVNGQNIGGQT